MLQGNDTYGNLVEPSPVRFSFHAPGWYIVGGLLLIAMIVMALRVWHIYRRNFYRREAVAQMEALLQDKRAANSGWLLYRMARLLKAVAGYRYGSETVALLRGAGYIAFLNSTWRQAAFTEEDGSLLGERLYIDGYLVMQPRTQALAEKIILWIKHHRYGIRNSV